MADGTPATWALTFGQKYRREPHPTLGDIDPDGFMTIEAHDIDEAFVIANDLIGSEFSHIYRYDTDEAKAAHNPHFPAGSLGDLSDLVAARASHLGSNEAAPASG